MATRCLKRAFFLWALSGLACQSIAGIEDRTLVAQVQGSAECEAYCSDVLEGCTGDFKPYPDRDTCITTCEAFPRGESGQANTLECRAEQAVLAKTTGEPASHCAAAGPDGAGKCGDACESYCSLLEKTCPDQLAGIADCKASCKALRTTAAVPFGDLASGDTLQCRLARLSVATLDSTQCSQTGFLPRGDFACQDDTTQPPTCDDYCRVVNVACTGAQAVYEDEAQCQAVCKTMDIGLIEHTTENTIGCRLYHSYSALAAPTSHCSHAGPAGDGHCGLDSGGLTGNCESYCTLMAAACSAEFSATFTDEPGCLTACATLDGAQADSGYTTTSAVGDRVQCRTLAASRALSDVSNCAAAVGQAAPCQ